MKARKDRRGVAAGLIPDWLDDLFLKSVIPVIRELTLARVNPNWLTVIAFLVTVAAAAVVLLDHLVAAAVLVIVGGILDFADGKVAALTGRVTSFGGVLDSTLDRYSDAALFVALVVHFAARGHYLVALAAIAALFGATMTSYLAALGLAHGHDLRVGILRRQDRVALIAAGLLFTFAHEPLAAWTSRLAPAVGLAPEPVPVMPLALAVVLLALLGNVTAVQRLAALLVAARAADSGAQIESRSADSGLSLKEKQMKTLNRRIGESR